ncbi:MAG: hypothetical protein ACC633_04450 [Anaerolineales bacterium]
MNEIINKLKEGDLRTIGNVPEVVDMVLANPELFKTVLQGMLHPDPGVRMRSSDAVEKISRSNPEYLQPHKAFLLNDVTGQTQQEVRWHLAQIIPRLELTDLQRTQTAKALFAFLDDPSKIVQTNALQALVELAWDDDELFSEVKKAVEDLAETGSPAVKNRADKLLPALARKDAPPQS